MEKELFNKKIANSVELFLFGGSVGHEAIDGFDVFKAHIREDTYRNFNSFREMVVEMLTTYGFSEETGRTEFLTDLQPNNNPEHHKFKIPDNDWIKKQYLECCEWNEVKPVFTGEKRDGYITVDKVFDFDPMVQNTKNPFEDDSVFSEAPDFFGDDTPDSIAKKVAFACKKEWYVGCKFEDNFEGKLVDLFKRWWPTKNNPVDLKAFLFGGGYHNRSMDWITLDGWNTFQYDLTPETFASFSTYKKAVKWYVNNMGFNQESEMCEELSEMSVDSNKDHHSYEMPDDETIKNWYIEQCEEYDIRPQFESNERTLSSLKQEAYRLKKEKGISHHQALEETARNFGFQHFHEAQKNLK